MKVFLDTNILLDVLSEERPGFEEALLILNIESLTIYAVADSIYTCKYVMRKEDNIDTLESLESMFEIVNIQDTKASTIAEAIEVCKIKNLSDLEDIAKLVTAIDLECDVFISNDKNLIKENPFENLAILKPFEFLKRFDQQQTVYETIIKEGV